MITPQHIFLWSKNERPPNILVTSIDEQMKKIEEAGGKILMPKQEVPGFGFVASFEDPAGTKMGLYQASPQAEQP